MLCSPKSLQTGPGTNCSFKHMPALAPFSAPVHVWSVTHVPKPVSCCPPTGQKARGVGKCAHRTSLRGDQPACPRPTSAGVLLLFDGPGSSTRSSSSH